MLSMIGLPLDVILYILENHLIFGPVDAANCSIKSMLLTWYHTL